MKLLLTVLVLVCMTSTAYAALSTPPVVLVTAEVTAPALDRKTIETRLGRKLNFAERLVLGSVKRKARRQARSGERSGPTDTLAVVSFGLGILTILTTLLGSAVFILFGLAAIVTGVISLINLSGKSDYKRGRGFAIAGIATPVAWLALIYLFIVLFFFN